MNINLPFNFGDTIYVPVPNMVLEYQVQLVILHEDRYVVETRATGGLFSEDLGKDWFLTKEDAENAENYRK